MEQHTIGSDGLIYDCGSPLIAPDSNTIWIEVQVEGNDWWSTRHGNMTVKDFIVVVQRNAHRLGFIEKDDSIQSLKLADVDGKKVVDLNLEDTLNQVKLWMGEDSQLVAVVLKAKVTTASEATSMSMVQLWPFANKNIDCEGQDGIHVHAHEHSIFDNVSPTVTDSEISDNITARYSSPPFSPTDMSPNEDATSDDGGNDYGDDSNSESDHDSNNDGGDMSDNDGGDDCDNDGGDMSDNDGGDECDNDGGDESNSDGDYHNQASDNNNKPKRRNQKVLTTILTISSLTCYFELEEANAAKKLDVSISSLKKKCRQLGLKRWPARKINQLTNAIRGLEKIIAKGGNGCLVEDLTRDCNMLKDAKQQFYNGDPETINELTKNKEGVPMHITRLLYSTGWRTREK